ncbi:MAG: hypothetical protein ACR2JO_02795 [Mycobacteriales bacterium]
MQVRWGAPASSVIAAFAVAAGLYLLVVLAFRTSGQRTVAELARSTTLRSRGARPVDKRRYLPSA